MILLIIYSVIGLLWTGWCAALTKVHNRSNWYDWYNWLPLLSHFVFWPLGMLIAKINDIEYRKKLRSLPAFFERMCGRYGHLMLRFEATHNYFRFELLQKREGTEYWDNVYMSKNYTGWLQSEEVREELIKDLHDARVRRKK